MAKVQTGKFLQVGYKEWTKIFGYLEGNDLKVIILLGLMCGVRLGEAMFCK